MITLKQCTGKNGCGRLLPKYMFYVNCNMSDGLLNQCIDCNKEYDHKNRIQRQQRQRNR